jgi:predicted outer membrane repeat protein
VIDLQDAGYLWQYYGIGRVRLEGLTVLHSNAAAFQILSIPASVEILDCTFQACLGGGVGGALHLAGKSVRVERCRFTGNDAWSGGAIHCASIGKLAVLDSIFEGNTGGAVAAENVSLGALLDKPHGDAVFARCTFLGNSTLGFGGAIYATRNYVRLESCLFAGNVAEMGGGLALGTIGEVDACTFVGNSAGTAGGAIFILDFPSYFAAGLLANSIVWGNLAPDGAAISLHSEGFGGASVDVRSSDVQGGRSGVHVEPGTTLVWGAGNLDFDPLFVDADGPDNEPLTLADNDWRLAGGSPCIDAGTDPLLPQDLADQDTDGKRTEATPFDLDGGARQQDDPAAPDVGVGPAPIVDLGAYERP